MSYESIDSIQEALAAKEFSNRKDAKKTAGRALGTVLEIITFYLLKDYGLAHNIAIERSLGEYANPSIGHNVEFTLHASTQLATVRYHGDDRASRQTEKNDFEETTASLLSGNALAKGKRPFSGDSIRNAATLYDDTENPEFPSIINAYPDTSTNTIDIYRLAKQPFAMIECKRVGVEKGMKKGPQTIEKAKQGAYVALSASKLQKFRRSDGMQMGILETANGSYRIEPYAELLRYALTEMNPDELNGIVLSIGVISDHGNWFSSDNKKRDAGACRRLRLAAVPHGPRTRHIHPRNTGQWFRRESSTRRPDGGRTPGVSPLRHRQARNLHQDRDARQSGCRTYPLFQRKP